MLESRNLQADSTSPLLAYGARMLVAISASSLLWHKLVSDSRAFPDSENHQC